MTALLVIVAALLLVFVAFRFVRGVIKFGLIALIILVAVIFGRQSGAF